MSVCLATVRAFCSKERLDNSVCCVTGCAILNLFLVCGCVDFLGVIPAAAAAAAAAALCLSVCLSVTSPTAAAA